eukprot:g1159.t1
MNLPRPRTAEERAAFTIVGKVLRNLATKEVEDENSKYRKLRLTNATIAAKLVTVASAVEFLCKVGFVREGEEFLVFKGPVPSKEILGHVQAIGKLLEPLAAVETRNSASNASYAGTTKSIKAQIRAKEEAKRKAQAEKERKERKRLLKKFDADKKARKDPNWKARVSSANMGAQPHAQASVDTNGK